MGLKFTYNAFHGQWVFMEDGVHYYFRQYSY